MTRDIEVSYAIINWLNSKLYEIQQKSSNFSFKTLREIFLQGNTLEESVAYVINLGNLIQADNFIQCLRNNIGQHVLEILPLPTESEIEGARQLLKSLGIDESIATCDIYIDNPIKAKREFWTFVLGDC